jgi:hypothetical protein
MSIPEEAGNDESQYEFEYDPTETEVGTAVW